MRSIQSPCRRILRPAFCTGAVLLIGWASAGSIPAQREAPLQPPGHVHGARRWFELGRASWYGHSFQGQATASGEAFNMNQMTCAHRSLPLGALIRVTNLHNHRSVVVRVNDRGPQLRSRIVDLSYGAAKILGFHGTARVRLDLVDASPTPQEVASLTWVSSAHR